jgi:hypothetical protein
MTRAKEIQRYIKPRPKIVLAGKPSAYGKKMYLKMRKYIKDCIDAGKTPWIEGFALSVGVSDRTVYNWSQAEGNEKFKEIYDLLKTVQKLDIKEKSLEGVYENPIAKIILSAEHNLVERVKTEHSGVDGEPIKVESSLSAEERKEYSEMITKFFEKKYSGKNGQ